MNGFTEVHRSRAIVVGSGVAGLTAALTLGRCTVVTKTRLGDGSTDWAQGGIAAAIGGDDAPALHLEDTLAVGGGLVERAVADVVTAGAPGRMRWLIEMGARFDRAPDGTLTLGREAGHSRRRIVHADGDATGAELIRTLRAAVLQRTDIEVIEGAEVLDLLRSGSRSAGDSRVVGVATRERGRLVARTAPAVVLATGGIGRVYAHTTNPEVVTGDGLAMAARAGARLADLEFVQFHPTALASGADPMPLLTEALRGEGAILVDDEGHRFMLDDHPAAELAPRDVVARSIWMRLTSGIKVYLDASSAVGAAFPQRFPTVFAAAVEAGIDPRRDPMPVSPAAHYHMGGIATDALGRTSLDGLWACGEASSTGLHGANRLASNSLLEGLVIGSRVAGSIDAGPVHPLTTDTCQIPQTALEIEAGHDESAIEMIRSTMWQHVGVVRTRDGLNRALATFGDLGRRAGHGATRNLLRVAELVAAAALERTESRGGHFRSDYPDADPALAARSFVTPPPDPTITIELRRSAAA